MSDVFDRIVSKLPRVGDGMPVENPTCSVLSPCPLAMALRTFDAEELAALDATAAPSGTEREPHKHTVGHHGAPHTAVRRMLHALFTSTSERPEGFAQRHLEQAIRDADVDAFIELRRAIDVEKAARPAPTSAD